MSKPIEDLMLEVSEYSGPVAAAFMDKTNNRVSAVIKGNTIEAVQMLADMFKGLAKHLDVSDLVLYEMMQEVHRRGVKNETILDMKKILEELNQV